jgi:hypothetical protein
MAQSVTVCRHIFKNYTTEIPNAHLKLHWTIFSDMMFFYRWLLRKLNQLQTLFISSMSCFQGEDKIRTVILWNIHWFPEVA